MAKPDDPLWDPQLGGDDELEHLELLLGRYGVAARGLILRVPAAPARAPRRRLRFAAIAACAAALFALAGFAYRLAWSDGAAWRVSGGALTRIAPGDVLRAGAGASLTIDVARIGRITLSPASTLRLVETRSGHHRVALDSGHLRARIWAPPGYFGVSDTSAEIVDLGCDFDVWKQADGRGRVFVRSGWIIHRTDTGEVLVPAGYAVEFDAQRASTPLRPEADAAFAQAVARLDASLDAPGTADVTAAEAVASAATDADAYTLLSLLSRYPALARTALYPRLAHAFKETGDDAHRAAWTAGDPAAIDAWWRHLPTSPKRWWLNWPDVFG